jgi:hypothetical protein
MTKDITGCQYIGPEQKEYPFHMCGHTTITGKVYCGEHFYKVYQKGTSVNGKRKERAVENEIAELKRQQEIDLIEE